MIGSADEFQRLRISDDAEDQRRASLEPADDRVWLDVIEHYPDLRTWVAYNKTVPLSILAVLAIDPDPRVRQSVAMKRKLDRSLFDLLAGDPDPSVRSCIVLNRKTPSDLLAMLRTDPDGFVAKQALKRTEQYAQELSALGREPSLAPRRIADMGVTATKPGLLKGCSGWLARISNATLARRRK